MGGNDIDPGLVVVALVIACIFMLSKVFFQI